MEVVVMVVVVEVMEVVVEVMEEVEVVEVVVVVVVEVEVMEEVVVVEVVEVEVVVVEEEPRPDEQGLGFIAVELEEVPAHPAPDDFKAGDEAGGLKAGSSIHVVLGGPEADVDTVASTLSLALHISQKDPHGPSLCVPVLPGGAEAALPRETVEYLQRVEVRETSLVWRDDVDLMALRHAGNLTLTLLRDDALNSSECSALASSVVRTVHRRGQRDAGLEEEEEASSAATTVAREILQEAAAHVRGALGEALGELLKMPGDMKALITHKIQIPQLQRFNRIAEHEAKWEHSRVNQVTCVMHCNQTLERLYRLGAMVTVDCWLRWRR
ncbi:Protein prune 2 [Merluccius polli]|uniref:Protein prune 2 n=1 Tax=Merluccius polli TaxID=89951 RepID=A0AA47MRM8_MERPO|nr:Protein prune 2 [Merluccius polli]